MLTLPRSPHVTVEWSVISLQTPGPADSSCYSGVESLYRVLMLQWSVLLSLYRLQVLRIPHVTVELSVISLQSPGPADHVTVEWSGVLSLYRVQALRSPHVTVEWSLISLQSPGLRSHHVTVE